MKCRPHAPDRRPPRPGVPARPQKSNPTASAAPGANGSRGPSASSRQELLHGPPLFPHPSFSAGLRGRPNAVSRNCMPQKRPSASGFSSLYSKIRACWDMCVWEVVDHIFFFRGGALASFLLQTKSPVRADRRDHAPLNNKTAGQYNNAVQYQIQRRGCGR